MSRPSVAVVIPWRPSPGRERNLTATLDALQAFGEADVILADSHADPFSRAGSRNVGVREAKADVLVVLDADAIVEPDPLHDAVNAAVDGKLHLPYDVCRLLTRNGSEAVIAGTAPHLANAWFVNTQSVGGCAVVTYETWAAVGGWDERFVGWGFEDTAFWAAVDTLFGHVRHDGTLHDLWHPDSRGIGTPQYAAGKALCDRYTGAQGNRHAMRALIEERACALV
jgi:glycosyltransferase involved in cell wall biosynthesis